MFSIRSRLQAAWMTYITMIYDGKVITTDIPEELQELLMED